MPAPNSLALTIRSEADVRGVGVGISISGGSPRIRQDLRRVVGIVGAFPWGSEGLIDSPNGPEFINSLDLLATLYPAARPDVAIIEMTGLEWGPLRVWNVRGTSPAAATHTFLDGSSGNSLVATAKKQGTDGNGIYVQLTQNGTTPTTRDATVTLRASDGTIVYTATYLAVQVSNGTVTDPGDPYVTFAKASGATAQAAVIAATALTGGSNGTIAASNYGEGITAFGGASGVDIIVCVGVSDSLVDDVNALGYALAESSAGDNKVYVACTESGLTKAEAITAAGAIPSANVRYAWPQISKYVQFAYRGFSSDDTFQMSPGASIANALQRLDPWVPVALEAARRSFINTTTAEVTSLARSDITDLMEAGVIPIARTSLYGFGPQWEVATADDPDTGLPYDGSNRRYLSQITVDIANGVTPYLGRPLDLNLAKQSTGPVSTAVVSAITGYLEREKQAGRITEGLNPADGSASPAYSVDPFGSASPSDVANGLWTIAIAVRRTPNAKFIRLNFRYGTYINIQAA